MKRISLFAGAAAWTALVCSFAVWADDWPTFRRDYSRSGATAESLDIGLLKELWAHAADQSPRPAWPGPARWDAFGKIPDLRSMRNYDPVFHVTAVGEAIFYASSADDCVRCLDAATGKVRWVHATQGPVRMAPTWYEGRLYFGSDDGHAYCIQAETGKLIWKRSPTEGQRLVIHDGRLISFWPVRTGVVVAEGTAYFGASLLPWKKSYLCAVDAKTGQPEGKGRYVKELENLTLEGGLLISAKRLIAPQGRVAPLVFDREDGKSMGSLHGATGGCFMLVTEDDQVVVGGGRGKGQITAGEITVTHPKNKSKVVSFQRGNAVVVKAERIWLLDDNYLTAMNRKTLAKLWRVYTPHACELLLAGNSVFVGGRDEVLAFDADTGKTTWRQPIHGRAHGLAVANGKLVVSTDEGRIHCFAPSADPAPKIPPPGVDKPKQPLLAPIAKVDPEGLIGRWVFQEPHVKQGNASSPPTVDDLAGASPGQILGPARLVRVGEVQALQFDGEFFGVELQADFKKARLPVTEFTAEAWVRVDQAQEWGGMLCAMQDNGPYERGWILGYNKDKFCLGVAAENGGNVMTYMTADKPFQAGRWYHVVGSYDGQEMKLFIDGRLAAKSAKQKGKIRYPEKAVYHLGAYRDDDELYPLKGMIHDVCLYDRVLSAEAIKQRHEARQANFAGAAEPPAELRLAEGPELRFQGPDKAVIRWKTAEPTPTLLEFGEGAALELHRQEPLRTSHEVTVAGLRKERLYQFRILAVVGKQTQSTAFMECDMHANIVAVRPALPTGLFPQDPQAAKVAEAVDGLLAAAPGEQGFCVVWGVGDGRLAHELARRTRMQVVAIDSDAARVARVREKLLASGAYGSRVCVLHVATLDAAVLPPCFANLVVCETGVFPDDTKVDAEKLFRVVRPDGGCLVLGSGSGTVDKDRLAKWAAGLKAERVWSDKKGLWLKLSRGPLEGGAAWTHQYGLPDNSGFAGEALGGASKTEDLEVLWFGQPGPRFNVDRNPRKPSPLAVGGRLFVQGMKRVAALDGFNGSVLWSVELPRFCRYNMPHDCSNWCCDSDRLFLAMDDQCWTLAAADGEVKRVHRLADALPAAQVAEADWGFVARADDLLVGSAVRRGSHFLGFWGGENWYDQKNGQRYVGSQHLFALRASDGELRWRRTGGTVINATITIADGRMAFVESRSAELAKVTSGQYGAELWKDLWLVSLDLATGKENWARPISPPPGSAAFYLSGADGKLVLTSADKGKFAVYAFAGATGEPVWNGDFPWEADHHGKHLSRPAIVGGQVVLRPYLIDLATGKQKHKGFPPGHGCGSYCATKNMLIFRGGEVVLWDMAHNSNTRWPRLRADCWISTIPANGMLLSPEGGGGCSCGQWLEMSVGFLPGSHK